MPGRAPAPRPLDVVFCVLLHPLGVCSITVRRANLSMCHAVWDAFKFFTWLLVKVGYPNPSYFMIHLSFSPPARWGLLDFIRVVLLLQLLLHHLLHPLPCSLPLANSSPSSSPTSARSGHCWTSTARVWAHWAPLDLNLGLSELSEHRWTSTWDRPSTAGPQPGTLRAQWAPLDLNLGPSELSEHRWTSTARYRRYAR